MRCAVVDIPTSTVVNIIMADPVLDQPMSDCMLIGVDIDAPCDIGWVYADGGFVNPNPPSVYEGTL